MKLTNAEAIDVLENSLREADDMAKTTLGGELLIAALNKAIMALRLGKEIDAGNFVVISIRNQTIWTVKP